MTNQAFRLRMLRLSNKLQASAVSKQSGIHQSTLSRVENGWRLLTPNQAESLIEAYRHFGVDAEKVVRQLVAA